MPLPNKGKRKFRIEKEKRKQNEKEHIKENHSTYTGADYGTVYLDCMRQQ